MDDIELVFFRDMAKLSPTLIVTSYDVAWPCVGS